MARIGFEEEAPNGSAHAAEVERTLRALEPEPRGAGCFLVAAPGGAHRLFGGLVAAQTVAAAARTVEETRFLHSIHGHFLRAGRGDKDLNFRVETTRDGGSFSTREVVVDQQGEAIFRATLSFARAEDGGERQTLPAPEVPGPEGLPDREQHRAASYLAAFGVEQRAYSSAVEVRLCDPKVVEPGEARDPLQANWMRLWPCDATRVLSRSGSENLQRALLVYATDRTMLATARLPLSIGRHRIMNVSLDHVVWVHRDFDLRCWHLMQATSPVMASGRAMVLAHVWNEQGLCVATVAQEGLVRVRR